MFTKKNVVYNSLIEAEMLKEPTFQKNFYFFMNGINY